ncbi:MAG: cobS [Paenibacillus sp.]|jgi:cobalamin 5'-phosphate synthase/cobalamin synthase|nr:cobS [Paenibacillus sp.]
MRNYRQIFVAELHAVVSAFQFLTRFPIRLQLNYTDDLFRRSAAYYPLVGAVLGVLLATAGWLLGLALPAAPAAVLLVALWAGATGALHMDGLMDTADGLLSHRSRERMLEIMKDSRVGAMGVIAGVLLALMKFALLVSLLPHTQLFLGFAVIAPLWSRWFVVWAIAGWPYAREGQGLGALFAKVGLREAFHATCWALLLSLLALLAVGLPWWQVVAGTIGLAIVAGALGYGLARKMAAKLGGLTGDTYGALAELLECAVLLVAVVLTRWL